MLRRPLRLAGTRDVARVYSRGQMARLGPFSLKHASNNLATSRLTVVVSKKVAKSAPLRNRIRRRVYAHFRLHWQRLAPGHDIVISIFAADVERLEPQKLHHQLQDLTERAGLLLPENPM